MRHLQLFIVLLIVTSALNSCKETSKSSEAKIESISQEYQAPYFEDTARVNKIKPGFCSRQNPPEGPAPDCKACVCFGGHV